VSSPFKMTDILRTTRESIKASTSFLVAISEFYSSKWLLPSVLQLLLIAA
jgi:hypothetical protein